jgi:nitrate/nitrite transporter NarK
MIIGFTALIIIQFLFGVGEAGAFPNIAKSLYNWFPANSRGFAKSGIWMSARLMGGLTPLLWVLIVEIGGLTWREAMWLFASAAAVWAIIFYFVFTNKPSEHSKVNAAELAVIHGNSPPPTHATVVPWGKLLQSRNLWCVCAMYVVTNFCWYFLMYNLPGALKNQFPEWKATDSGKCLLAILAGSPLLVGILGCYLGGVLSDRYIRRTGDRKWGRRIFGMLGYGGAAVR